jgi:acetyl-CoA carboxylase carboxyl transferase subunit beta
MGIFEKFFRKKREEENLWTKCSECKTLLYVPDLERNLRVCPKCGSHMSMSAVQRVETLLDEKGAESLFEEIKPSDPLRFKDSRSYKDRLKKAQEQTGLSEAMVVMRGTIEGRGVIISAMDFGFIGGSMGTVVGERFFRACFKAVEDKLPLISITCSGGARMQEGILSLMQMAKTTLGVGMLRREKIPFITVLANPTTGGVSASFAFLGDVIIAEPGALIGFAGPRVIQQTIKQELPEGFQRAEFLLEKGMVDMVVPRKELKKTLVDLLDLTYYSKRF